MKKMISAPLLAILTLAACTGGDPAATADARDSEASVFALVESMSDVWNAGDMPGYLDLYARDERTTLIFADVITTGWQQISDLYTGTWSTEEKMGDFETERVTVRLLDDDTATANGIFRHQFTDHLVVGAFSLVVQKAVDGRWKIVHEHTSRSRDTQ